MEWISIVAPIVTLLLGLIIGWFLGLSRSASASLEGSQGLRSDAAAAREDAARARQELAEAKAETAHKASAQAELRVEISQLQALLAEERIQTTRAEAATSRARAQAEAAAERLHEALADREELQRQFKQLSAESLEAQGKKTQEMLVAPVAEGLKTLQERINAVEKERVAMHSALQEQLTTIRLSEEALRSETLNLTNALRTPQIRGSWGEQSLRRIVEISGLTSRVDFEEQVSTQSFEGNKQRPDMRIRLSGGRVIFVDSKVPLAAVLEAYQSEDESKRAACLARFARHVRTHIDQLSSKNYWEIDAGSPEFVVLFLGSDEFYRLAQQQLPDLHDYAARRKIMLACPGILIPLLHIVAHGWSQEALAESAAQVAKLGREIYSRLSTMGSAFSKLGRSLNQSVDNYNKAMASLESRVLVSARRFQELSITKDELPALKLIDNNARAPLQPELAADSLPPASSNHSDHLLSHE